MLMEAAEKYRRYRAPQGDGQKLLDPPREELAGALVQNQKLARAARDYDVQGRSLGELASSARSDFLRKAVAYTTSYSDLPGSITRSAENVTAPLMLSGHQPQLFHPGVWYKNFAAAQLARQTSGIPIHLIIDSDVCRTTSILVPAGRMDAPQVEGVAMDHPADDMPFEERTVQDEAFFRGFVSRVADAQLSMPDKPVVNQLWPLVVERQSEVRQIGLRLAQGRHLLERAWGNETLEVPLSMVCSQREFFWFVAHILAHLPRFWTIYNEALAAYRTAHHLRNRAQPVPDLNESAGWLEAPFWVWRTGDRERRPLFARQSGDGIQLSDQQGWSANLELSTERDAEIAVEQLAELAEAGPRIRTRALTTTLFARLALCDLFFHGIGGAKYDQVTDDLVRNFFDLEPPRFATCSATLRLPLPILGDGKTQISPVVQQLRELTYHPERFLSDGSDWSAAGQLVTQKLEWVRTPKTVANAHQRHRAIEASNRDLQPYVVNRRRELEAQYAQIQDQMRASAILESRDYSFCLYPERLLKRMLLD